MANENIIVTLSLTNALSHCLLIPFIEGLMSRTMLLFLPQFGSSIPKQFQNLGTDTSGRSYVYHHRLSFEIKSTLSSTFFSGHGNPIIILFRSVVCFFKLSKNIFSGILKFFFIF